MGQGGTDGRTDGQTDERTGGQILPVFYRTSSPSGPLPKKQTPKHYLKLVKQEMVKEKYENYEFGLFDLGP